jgi:hypothetical protein
MQIGELERERERESYEAFTYIYMCKNDGKMPEL